MTAASIPRVSALDRFAGALSTQAPGLLRRIGDWETRVLAQQIATLRIDRPVYVCGLARAGSTLLLESLAKAAVFTTHRYADFPLVWAPYWWNWLRAGLPLPAQEPAERAHRDRIAVTRESPEALEEILWIHFFPGRHDPGVDQTLGPECLNPGFASFYSAHIRKLLLVRAAQRYLAKNNYNLGRIGFLMRLFPDARFVIAVREPRAHVASLLKQDRLFCAWGRDDPAITRQLARSGHFEFGPHKRAENLGNADEAAAIQQCFDSGRAVEGYARQWAAAYGWLAARLQDGVVSRACIVVRYEQLCAAPAQTLASVYEHAGVSTTQAQDLVRNQAPNIAPPDYYSPEFTESESETISTITQKVWHSLTGRE